MPGHGQFIPNSSHGQCSYIFFDFVCVCTLYVCHDVHKCNLIMSYGSARSTDSIISHKSFQPVMTLHKAYETHKGRSVCEHKYTCRPCANLLF